MSRPEKAHVWKKEKGDEARNKTHRKKNKHKNMKDDHQENLKKNSHSLHYTTQRTHALFLERGAAFFLSFPQLSGRRNLMRPRIFAFS
jgi:hypothetical protein